jgi:predicted Zn finger-like uncharacterized protein
MLILCPNCDTQFSVPDGAIGEKGRTLKCAKCAHKWFYKPESKMAPETTHIADEAGSDSGVDIASIAATLESSLSSGGREELGASGEQREPRFEAARSPSPKDFAMEDDAPPRPNLFAETPQPIPDVFTRSRETRSRSGGGLGTVLVLLVVVLAAVGGALVYFQDKVIAVVPEAAPVYQTVGLRSESVGAGLIFRNYSSERPVQDGNEVLIVRGIIANTTDKQRDIPMLRLVLFDKADGKLQEKVVRPPAASLDAGGTVGFRIALDQPNPEAVRFELTFTAGEGR